MSIKNLIIEWNYKWNNSFGHIFFYFFALYIFIICYVLPMHDTDFFHRLTALLTEVNVLTKFVFYINREKKSYYTYYHICNIVVMNDCRGNQYRHLLEVSSNHTKFNENRCEWLDVDTILFVHNWTMWTIYWFRANLLPGKWNNVYFLFTITTFRYCSDDSKFENAVIFYRIHFGGYDYNELYQ